MSKRNNQLLLIDIVDSIDKIEQYTSGLTKESFLKDSKTCDAVIRNFEIIGEAANRLTEEFKDKHTHIDWFRIKGFRNRIVHDYMGIDYQIVWTIIERDLQSLKLEIEKLLQ